MPTYFTNIRRARTTTWAASLTVWSCVSFPIPVPIPDPNPRQPRLSPAPNLGLAKPGIRSWNSRSFLLRRFNPSYPPPPRNFLPLRNPANGTRWGESPKKKHIPPPAAAASREPPRRSGQGPGSRPKGVAGPVHPAPPRARPGKNGRALTSGSSAKSSLPWNSACPDKKAPAGGTARGATIDPTLPVTALLDLMGSAPLRGGDGERKR